MRILVAIFFSLFLISCSLKECIYFGRTVLWNMPGIEDHTKFASSRLNNAPPTYHFRRDTQKVKWYSRLLRTVEYPENHVLKKAALESFLRENGTLAFIIIKNDSILYEKYFNGFHRDSLITSFSISKSILSALIGIAVAEGHITSLDEKITKYIPELQDNGMGNVTIRDLLSMSSGIEYRNSILPWTEKARSYFWPDLRDLVLSAKAQEEPNEHFNYNEYDPLIAGMILERAIRRPVSLYLQDRIWKRLGMEYPASWSIDSRRSGFEKMGTGINAAAIDFAKIGRLFLHGGNWNGKQIIPEEWVRESCGPPGGNAGNKEEYYGPYDRELWDLFFSNGGYYKYFWWGYRTGSGYDFFAMGSMGQYIYICPQRELIIVRFGEKQGDVDWWPDVLRGLAEKIG